MIPILIRFMMDSVSRKYTSFSNRSGVLQNLISASFAIS